MAEKKNAAQVLIGQSFFSHAFFQPLVRRISSPEVSDFFKNLRLSKKKLNTFQDNLGTLDAILDDAELNAYEDDGVKAWFDELTKVASDLEDLLDEIAATEELNRHDKDSIAPFWKSFPVKPTPSEKVLKQLLKDLIAQVKDLKRRGRDLELRKSVDIDRLVFQQSAREYSSDYQIFGRDKDKEALVKMLVSDNHNNRGTDVITMLGKRGVGKTTLAQLVYNDEQVKKHFDLRCWVYVSEEFDDAMLAEAIFHGFSHYQQSQSENMDSEEFGGFLTEASFTGISSPELETEDVDSLQYRLKQNLMRKKFLLVLDNLTVSTDWRRTWKNLTAMANGSKIIVTTHQSELLGRSPLPAYIIKQLEDRESWMLFMKNAFPHKISTSVHPKIATIRKEIAEKCCGLPIVARVLGTVLHKFQVEEWNIVLNNNSLKWDANMLTSLLRMSYGALPLHLKRCVAFCSMFPKYHEFEEEKLIRLWMAEGFIPQNRFTRMEELGSEYFRDLIWRSFFQPSGASECSFVMQDLWYDLVSSESGFICSRMGNAEDPLVSSTPWHVLISGNNYLAEHCKALEGKTTFLRTLIFYKSTWDTVSQRLSGEQLNNLFESLQHLQVLSLSRCGITKLPDSIGNLKRLCYLDLSYSAITELPACVSSLSHLQTLSLSHCSSLVELPDSFRELKILQFLDFSYTGISKLPDDFSSLFHLRTLLLSHCSCLSELPDSFQELRNLEFLDLSHTGISSLPNTVGSLTQLQKLLLSQCYHLTELPNSFKMRNLQILDLSHTAITSLPESVGSLFNLQKLLLSHCSHLTELPEWFWKLHNLHFLDLSHTGITSLPSSFSLLNGLQTVLLSDCHSVTVLPENMRQLINLQRLDIRRTHLNKMPANISRLTNLQNLSDFVVAKDSGGSKLTELGSLINLRETLQISQLQNVESSWDAYEAHLKKKDKLKALVLRWSEDRVDFQKDEDVLEQLKPNKNLEHLTVVSYLGTSFPEWLGDSSFYKMVFLCLSNCNRCLHLPPLGKLPSLKVIQIKQMNGVKRIGSEFYGTDPLVKPFPSLEILVFREMLEWEEWNCSDVGREEFPSLKQLYISRCPKLAKFSSLCLPQLAEIVTVECPLLRVPAVDGRQLLESNDMQSGRNDELVGGQASPLPESNLVLDRHDVLIASKTQTSENPNEEPTAQQREISDNNNNEQIKVEVSLESPEESRRQFPVPSHLLTEGSSSMHGGISDNYAGGNDISTRNDYNDTINLEECLADAEASRTSHLESPKSGSVEHGVTSENDSATETSCDADTNDPSNDIEEESIEDVSSPEQESLNVSEISQLKRLPVKLNSLKIENCDALKSLKEESMRDNSYLRHLYIVSCRFLKIIHQNHLPISLKALYIHNCRKVEFAETVADHTSLEDLCLESCEAIRFFPLASFPKLKYLSIRDCGNFKSIVIGLGYHLSLDALEIRDCSKLTSFTEGEFRIPNLTSIVISNCKSLKVLPGQLHDLTSLQSLLINQCPELKSIPEGGLPSSLHSVSISFCYRLTPRIDWGLHNLESFSCIDIEDGCRDLESFPEQNLLPKNLTSLRISRLMNLRYLNNKGFENLTSLETLKINSCYNLQTLPEDCLPSSLTCLCITDCPLLKPKLQNKRGREWYKIAHIPQIQIDDEIIS